MKPLILVIVFTAYCAGIARAASEAAAWRDRVAQQNVEQLAATLGAASRVKWPRIESEFAYQQLPAERRAEGAALVELANTVQRILADSTRQNIPFDQDHIIPLIEQLGIIGDSVGRGGGYSNLVLQDAVARLQIWYLSGWLVRNPGSANRAQTLFERIHARQVRLPELFSELADQDSLLSRKREEVASIDPNKSVLDAFVRLGLPLTTDPAREKTSTLLQDSSAPILARRMATTEALKWVHLRGLIDFLRAGGSFSELTPGDIRKFEARIGPAARNYKYPLLSIRRLNLGYVRTLVQWHHNDDAGRGFLEVAVN